MNHWSPALNWIMCEITKPGCPTAERKLWESLAHRPHTSLSSVCAVVIWPYKTALYFSFSILIPSPISHRHVALWPTGHLATASIWGLSIGDPLRNEGSPSDSVLLCLGFDVIVVHWTLTFSLLQSTRGHRYSNSFFEGKSTRTRCKQWMHDSAFCARMTHLTAADIAKIPGPMPTGHIWGQTCGYVQKASIIENL